LAFGTEHGGDRIAAALADDDNYLALARLILGKATIKAIFFDRGPWLNQPSIL
jgi:hypothetical protein